MREYLDGPGLYAWLNERGCDLSAKVLNFHSREVRRWRSGTAATVWSADQVLTQLGLHLTEIPDDLWRDSPYKNNGGKRIDPRIRRAALIGIRRGDTVHHVAQRFAIDGSTVRRWMKEERLFPAGADPNTHRKKVAA